MIPRKNYRTFWIGILHDGTPTKRRFTVPEQMQVALRVVWPQVALVVAFSLLLVPIANLLPSEAISSLNSLGQLFLIFVIGPVAIQHAISASYTGFRLQAYLRAGKIRTGAHSDIPISQIRKFCPAICNPLPWVALCDD